MAEPTIRVEVFKKHVVRLMKKIATIPEGSMEVFLWDLIHMSIGQLRHYSYQTFTVHDKDKSVFRANLGIKIIGDRVHNALLLLDNGAGRNEYGLMSDFVDLEEDDVKLYERKIDECLMSGDGDLSAYYNIQGICLGVYAAFMVANKVVVHTRPLFDDDIYTWESQGLIDDSGSYKITRRPAPADFIHRGTMVALYLKQEHAHKYLAFEKLTTLVNNLPSFSHCAYPIQLNELRPEGEGDTEQVLHFLDRSQHIDSLRLTFEPLRKICSRMLGDWVKEVVIDDTVFDLPVALSNDLKRFEINPRHHSIQKMLQDITEDHDAHRGRVAHMFQLHYHKLLDVITMWKPLGSGPVYHARFAEGCGTFRRDS